MIFALIVAALLIGAMMSLAHAEPDTARLRAHRRSEIGKQMAAMRRDRF